MIEDGASIEDVRATLEGFQQLSDAGKSVVGDQEFSVYTFDNDNNITGYTDEYNDLSQADKDVISDQMPLLSSN